MEETARHGMVWENNPPQEEPEGARSFHKELVCTHTKRSTEKRAGGKPKAYPASPRCFQAYGGLVSMNAEKRRSTTAGWGTQTTDSKHKHVPRGSFPEQAPARVNGTAL